MLEILPRYCVCGQYTCGTGVLVRKVLTSHGRRCFLVLTMSVDVFFFKYALSFKRNYKQTLTRR